MRNCLSPNISTILALKIIQPIGGTCARQNLLENLQKILIFIKTSQDKLQSPNHGQVKKKNHFPQVNLYILHNYTVFFGGRYVNNNNVIIYLT